MQTDVFFEEENQNVKEIVKKYFDCFFIKKDDILGCRGSGNVKFRGSLFLAKVLGQKFEFANALSFIPNLRKYSVSPDAKFNDLSSLRGRETLFIRPVSPFKEFAGNVYTPEKFEEEYNFLTTYKNVDKHIICAYATPVKIGREWRCIFVNNEYCAGSQYLNEGELDVLEGVEEKVITFAKKIAKENYFINIFDFVIDIGETEDGLKLIEINAFETSSFYGADLDKIYKTWAENP